MGREIRRVPPNWQHPKDDRGYRPLFDEPYLPALDEWITAHRRWESGEDPDRAKNPEIRYYAEWNGNPPEVSFYRPDWPDGSATWYQVYETVSEGTPVTPPFETQEELVHYLTKVGDFWDQSRRDAPWTEANARQFVFTDGWAPSLISNQGRVYESKETPTALQK